MVSRAPALEPAAAHVWTRRSTGILKAAVGLGLLAALLFFGRIDLKALSVLSDAPSVIGICLALLALSVPLAAVRWGILLRALGLSIPFRSLLHFVAIGLVANLFVFGTTGGDAVRGLYAWRSIGGASPRVAVSVIADRLFSLLALLFLSLTFTLFSWHWMRQIPGLAALGTMLFVAFAAGALAGCTLIVIPTLMRRLEERLSRWPLLARLATQARDVIVLFRASPFRLLGAFVLAVAIQLTMVACVVMLADAVKIGNLRTADFLFAVPLTFLANSLPLTPSGIGIGEAAFEQICHWLEPVPSNAAYSSIFFAFRAISMVVSLAGLVSFVIYRNKSRSDAA